MDEFPSRERTAAAALEPRVSAVVVVRNVHKKLPGQAPLDLCLRSALAEPMIDDLIVVDQKNGPEVSTALRALQADRRDVKVITAPPNAGYAAAANLGAREALGRWLVFLDPGVVLQRGAIARMAGAGDEAHRPCIVGGRLTDLEGRERVVARAGALNAFSALAVAMDLPARKPKRAAGKAAPVAAVSAAFMAIPRRDFEALHGFDEEFKTDCADLDLCRRANAAGGAILFHPAAAGVQFVRPPESGRRQAQGLARFVARSAKTGPEKAFAAVAEPALAVLLALKNLVVGRPPIRR
ncbi:MAG TPA: glycosyltransferase [Vitreimonas sp.]|nr:glycosyltransferase [Vitreimonas sp.]